MSKSYPNYKSKINVKTSSEKQEFTKRGLNRNTFEIKNNN